jgi:serine/threonine protein kinase
MSSGELPLSTYHRAQSIGAGTFGSVITVYNDDGEQFALKLFDDDDENDDAYGIGLGTLREISVLRLLRGENAHPNIVEIHDVQTSFGEDVDEDVGAGTNGSTLAMAMPLYEGGSLADSFAKITTRRQKAVIAHGLLSAVAYLHENTILHRDIKSDNVLTRLSNDNDDNLYEPVLCDFSLAKVIHPETMMVGGDRLKKSDTSKETEQTHTQSVGTPTYRAPEVVNEKPYGLASDLWSVGVVLLELLRGSCLEVVKDHQAIAKIEEALESLPKDQPFPSLIRGLLQKDPTTRWTARQALECEFFQKFGLTVSPQTFHKLHLPTAAPLEGEEETTQDENTNKNNAQGRRKKKTDPVLSKRLKFIQKVCTRMDWDNCMTAQAALTYSIQMGEVCEDVDDLSESTVLLDCIVVAHKFFEKHLSDQSELEEMYQHFGGDFDVENFSENESTLLLMMDMCLYPRTIRNDV